MARAGVVCFWCGHGFDLKLPVNHAGQLSADHIIPVRDGGGSGADNIRPMHRACNLLLDRWGPAYAVIAGQA